jgi:phosphate transport system substrate-binding protein
MKAQILLKLPILFVLTLTILTACNHPQNPLAYQTDTHSRGKAVVYIEESFKPLFNTSIETFQGQYPKATIVPKYMGENEIIQAMYDRKAKTIVVSRDLSEKEIKFLKSVKIEVRRDKVAVDAIALIIHPSNKDTLITVQELKSLLTGKNVKWKATGNEIKVVYDKPNSANYNYLTALCGKQANNKQIFAAKSNEEVINFVKNNPNAIGVIGLNWISDDDDFDTKDFLNGIKVMAVAKDSKSEYFQPYNGFMYTKEYPLVRDIWMINKGKRSGLNTGFVLFMKNEIGQTIIQQAGLVPANSPVRLIQFTGQ